jgi:hypothetical protein
MHLTLTSVWILLNCHRRDEHDFPVFHSFGLHNSPFPYSLLFGSSHAPWAKGHNVHLLHASYVPAPQNAVTVCMLQTLIQMF